MPLSTRFLRRESLMRENPSFLDRSLETAVFRVISSQGVLFRGTEVAKVTHESVRGKGDFLFLGTMDDGTAHYAVRVEDMESMMLDEEHRTLPLRSALGFLRHDENEMNILAFAQGWSQVLLVFFFPIQFGIF